MLWYPFYTGNYKKTSPGKVAHFSWNASVTMDDLMKARNVFSGNLMNPLQCKVRVEII